MLNKKIKNNRIHMQRDGKYDCIQYYTFFDEDGEIVGILRVQDDTDVVQLKWLIEDDLDV